MRLRVVSDLHVDFWPDGFNKLHPQERDRESVLVIAGDISNGGKSVISFLERLRYSSFRKVIFVAGNHEFYNDYFYDLSREFSRRFPASGDKVVFLDNESIEIDDVKFIGCTLWTDFSGRSVECMNAARKFMNCFSKIGLEKGRPHERFSPEQALIEHAISKRFIEKELISAAESGKKVVVITHMAPSFLSAPIDIIDCSLPGTYCSKLDDTIKKRQPCLWIHGHVHKSLDYIIENTRIVCNPLGYLSLDTNPDFQDPLYIEV